jgi:hypothetical protein
MAMSFFLKHSLLSDICLLSSDPKADATEDLIADPLSLACFCREGRDQSRSHCHEHRAENKAWDVIGEFRDGKTGDHSKDYYREEERQHIESGVERVDAADSLEVDGEEVDHYYHRAADTEGEEEAGCSAALFKDVGCQGGVF